MVFLYHVFITCFYCLLMCVYIMWLQCVDMFVYIMCLSCGYGGFVVCLRCFDVFIAPIVC